MGRLIHLLRAAMPIVGWIAVVKIIDGMPVIEAVTPVRSLRPSEVVELLVAHAEQYLGPYLALAACAGGSPRCSELGEYIERGIRTIAEHRCRGREDFERCVEEEMARLRSLGYYDLWVELRKIVEPVPSFLFIGPPGIGKSESVMEAARRIAEKFGLNFVDVAKLERTMYASMSEHTSERLRTFLFVDLRLTSVEPADLMGIPRLVGEKYSDYVPFAWAKMLAAGPGMLFLDEFTNVRREDVMSAAYQLVLDRKAGFTYFDPGVIIVAAGNSPEHSKIARKLPTPLHERFKVFNVIPPTIEDWRRYMERRYGDAWAKSVLMMIISLEAEGQGWVATKGLPPTALGPDEQYPNPRAWTRLARELYLLYLPLARARNTTVDDIVIGALEYAFFMGSCLAARNIVEPRSEEERLAKMVCEEIASNVGSRTATTVSLVMGVPLVFERDGKLVGTIDAILEGMSVDEAIERTVSYLRRKADEIESRIAGMAISEEMRNAIRALLDELRNPEECRKWVLRKMAIVMHERLERIIVERGKEAVKRLAPLLARIVDELYEAFGGEGWILPFVSTMFAPICRRKWIDIKLEVRKYSRHLDELLEKAMAG